MRVLILTLVCAVSMGLLQAASENLEIYFVDVEGGAATLVIAPSGESMLIDTANPGANERDADRIYAAAKLAGLTKINYLVTTHYHGDHIGALRPLLNRIPIERFYDHGEIGQASTALYESYLELSTGRRTIVAPGDTIPLKGASVQIVSAHGKVITSPINGGGANPSLCSDPLQKGPDRDPDNNNSVGFLLTFGKFKFLNLGDLGWQEEHLLACPQNLLGKVDVYQTTHHGLDRSGAPQLVRAIEPRVAVMNNGSRKGGAPLTFETLRASSGPPDVWQGHLSDNAPRELQTAENMIANLEPTGECAGHWIKITVEPGGAYRVTNGRNGFSKTYEVR